MSKHPSPPVTATRARAILLAPAAVAVAWLGGTLLLWLATSRRPEDLTGSVLLVALSGVGALMAGYWLSLRGSGVGDVSASVPERLPRALSPSLAAGIAVAGGLYYAGRAWGIVAPVATAGWDISDPVCSLTRAYVARQEALMAAGDPGGLQSLLNLFGVLQYVTIPLLVLLWGSLPRWARTLGTVGVAAYCFAWLLVGSVKGLAETALVVLAAMLVWVARVALGTSKGTRLSGRAVALAAGAAVLGGALLAVTLLGSRVVDPKSCFLPDAPGQGQGTGQGPGQGGGTISIVGAPQGTGARVLLDYVTHGYSGLSSSLSLPFVWTKGVGASPGLDRLNPFVSLPSDPALGPYPVRAEKATGWPAYGRWQTMYPWLASDLTFPGAVLLVGLVGFGFGLSWARAVRGRSAVLATSWFSFLMLLVVYLPLNNQPIAATSAVIGLMSLVLVTVWTRLARRTPVPAAADTPDEGTTV